MNDRSHPDLGTLSDHDAGLLDEPDTDEVERHLRACADCRAAVDSVVRVRGALRAVGSEPETMPSEVSERLTATLRAERPAGPAIPAPHAGAAGEAADPADPRAAVRAGDVAPGGPRRGGNSRRSVRRSTRWGRAIAVAAGVAVLAVGGTVAQQQLTTGDPGGDGPVATDENDHQGQGSDEDAGGEESGGTYALSDDDPVRLTEDRFDEQVRSTVVRETASGEDGGDDGNSGEHDGPTTPGPSTSEDAGPTSSLQDDGNAGLADPDRCVVDALEAEGIDAEVSDTRPVEFDGDDAMLAITPGSSNDAVRAYAITGCPRDGSVAHRSEITVR